MPTVLVVDDDPDVRALLEMCLALEGFDVLTASNGRHALLRLNEIHPALILLDLMMPVMDGVEFRRQQREEPRLRDIPLVCLSARHAARKKANEPGFAAVHRKPLDFET